MSNSVANTTISCITEATGRDNAGTITSGYKSQGGGRGEGRGSGHGRGGRGGRTPCPSHVSFKGDTEGMSGNIFQCSEELTDRRQLARTQEALEAYTSKNLKCGKYLSLLFDKEMTKPKLEKPVMLVENASAVDKAICWDQVQAQPSSSPGRYLQTMQQSHERYTQVTHSFQKRDSEERLSLTFGTYLLHNPGGPN